MNKIENFRPRRSDVSDVRVADPGRLRRLFPAEPLRDEVIPWPPGGRYIKQIIIVINLCLKKPPLQATPRPPPPPRRPLAACSRTLAPCSDLLHLLLPDFSHQVFLRYTAVIEIYKYSQSFRRTQQTSRTTAQCTPATTPSRPSRRW